MDPSRGKAAVDGGRALALAVVAVVGIAVLALRFDLTRTRWLLALVPAAALVLVTVGPGLLEGRSRLERVTATLGLLALLGVVLGGLYAHEGIVAPGLGFLGWVLAVPLSLAAIVLGLVARFRRRRRRERPRWAELAPAVFVLALVGSSARPGYPVINDVTTDPEDPPPLAQASYVPELDGHDLDYPVQFAPVQREAYPDLAPARLALPPEEAFVRVGMALAALPVSWVSVDRVGHRIEGQATSWLFRFVDDVVVEVRPDGRGGSLVHVRSRSRDGRGDLGVNAERVRRILAAVREAAPGSTP